jgi:DNA polymerase elongation subunit (family B)
MNFYTNVHLVGDNILYRGVENGRKVITRKKLSPTLFIKSNKESKYKTLDGLNVEPVHFEKVSEAREFIEKYKKIDNFDVYGNTRFMYQFICDEFPEEHIQWDINQINLVTIDIETASENGFPNIRETSEEVLLISVKDFTTKQITVFGSRPYENTRSDVKFIKCEDEHHLLRAFIYHWTNNFPDIVTGWNVDFFDIPYLCGRIARILGEKEMKSLSPWNMVRSEEVNIKGRNQLKYDIVGLSVCDYLDLYRRFTYTNQESYRLDYIAQVELGEQKLDHSEFENFKDFYTKNWQKFVDYNIHDVELVDKFEDKMKLIELAITMAYDSKVNYNDIHYQVRMWDNIIFNHLKKDKIVIPPKKPQRKDSQYAGAYVKEPTPGMYEWVVSFDLNSLYPHLIMQYNISPETLVQEKHPSINVDRLLNKEVDLQMYGDYAVCANGAMYRKDKQGFLPELMQKMYNDRVIFKKKMIEAKKKYEETKHPKFLKDISTFNNIQMAKKISLNSAYGAIGNEYFRYFRIENAEAITLSGQVSIRWIENKMNEYLNNLLQTKEEDYVIASDTDSIYLNLGPLVSKFFANQSGDKAKIVGILDKICQDKLEPFIESSYQELANYVSAYEQKMTMKRENIADKGIWTAKKRYMLNVWDSEGVRYEKPKLKMMGIEAVKSSTPSPCRTKIKEAINIIMTKTEDDLIDFIEEFRKGFKKLPPEDVSFPRSVNGLTKFRNSGTIYSKGTPIHVRGTLLYNYYIKQNNLTAKYPLVQDGEKIKFIYLKMPNKINENVVSFLQTFPRELGLEPCIDWELQFTKSFLDPLKIILDSIGWKTERVGTLDFLFG